MKISETSKLFGKLPPSISWPPVNHKRKHPLHDQGSRQPLPVPVHAQKFSCAATARFWKERRCILAYARRQSQIILQCANSDGSFSARSEQILIITDYSELVCENGWLGLDNWHQSYPERVDQGKRWT